MKIRIVDLIPSRDCLILYKLVAILIIIIYNKLAEKKKNPIHLLKISGGDSALVAIFQPIFSFIHCYHLQFHRRFQPFPLLSFAIPIAPFHTVSLGSFTPPPSLPPPFPRFFFFCFTPLRSLQPVLRQPVIPPLFFWLANCAHTRALEHTKRHLSLSRLPPFFPLSLFSPSHRCSKHRC